MSDIQPIKTDWEKRASLMQVILFVSMIFAPMGAMLSGDNPDMGQAEKRKLSSFPIFSWSPDSLKTYPKKFEAYFNDHFGLRKPLIQLHSYIQVNWFNTSTSDRVILGNDGWYFYGAETVLDNYLGQNKLSNDELKHSVAILEGRRKWLARHGVQYLLVIAPDKHSIYPEHLPTDLRQQKVPTLLDQLTEFLEKNSDFVIIDPRQAIIEEKKNSQVYFKTDTHWTDAGAFAAYQQVMTRIAEGYPDIHILGDNDFNQIPRLVVNPDLTNMLGLGEFNREEEYEFHQTSPNCARKIPWKYRINPNLPGYHRPFAMRCDKPGLPRAVIFGDSFIYTQFSAFLSESFSDSVFMLGKFNRQHVALWIKRVKPDYFIEEVVERSLIQSIVRGR